MNDQTFTVWRERYDAWAGQGANRVFPPAIAAAVRPRGLTWTIADVLVACLLCPLGEEPTNAELAVIANCSEAMAARARRMARGLGLRP
jgi:hypothetical protein